jgi:hypothetical protein
MKKSPGSKVALVLFLMSSASWAVEPAPRIDPLWRAVILAPPSASGSGTEADPGAALFLAAKSQCTATADCDYPATVTCSGSGTCTAVDRNCDGNQRGYVSCDSVVKYCKPDCPVEIDCSPFDHEGCIYSFDAESNCCVAPPPSPETVCPYACF